MWGRPKIKPTNYVTSPDRADGLGKYPYWDLSVILLFIAPEPKILERDTYNTKKTIDPNWYNN